MDIIIIIVILIICCCCCIIVGGGGYYYINYIAPNNTQSAPTSGSNTQSAPTSGSNTQTAPSSGSNTSMPSSTTTQAPTTTVAPTTTINPKIVPDFFSKFGNNTTEGTFEFNGWKLVSSIGTYGNEGLPAILCSVPPPLYQLNNYPRMAGFLQSSVIIGIIMPTASALTGFDWYGCANYGSNRNAKNVEVYGSNTNLSSNLTSVTRTGNKIFSFTLPESTPTTISSITYTTGNTTSYSSYYFVVLNNYGDSSVKIGSINLKFS
jgi:hypothetical protein